MNSNKTMLSNFIAIFTIVCAVFFVWALPNIVNTLSFYLPNTPQREQPGVEYLRRDSPVPVYRVTLYIAQSTRARVVVTMLIAITVVVLSLMDKEKRISDPFNMISIGVMFIFGALNLVTLLFFFYRGNVTIGD